MPKKDFPISKEGLEALYIEGGRTQRAIAKQLHIGPAFVSRTLKRWGIPFQDRRGGHQHDKRIPREELYDLYVDQRLSTIQISKRHNVCPQTVANWLAYYSIPQRPQGWHVKSIKRPPLSEEWKRKISDAHKRRGSWAGEKNYNWQGGIMERPYPLEWTEELRESIRQRDGHQCVQCGATEGGDGRELSVHHKNMDKNDNRAENLESLCNRCHCIANRAEKFWSS